MNTVEHEVSITLDELRHAVVIMTEVLSNSELQKMPNEQLPLVHAFQLGCLLRAVGIAPASVPTVLEFVKLGYQDYGSVVEENEGIEDA